MTVAHDHLKRLRVLVNELAGIMPNGADPIGFTLPEWLDRTKWHADDVTHDGDGYAGKMPMNGSTEGGGSKGVVSNPTMRAALARVAMSETLTRVETALAEALGMLRYIERTIRANPPGYVHGDRVAKAQCSAKVNPLCTNIASPHTDEVDGVVYAGLCDACWPISCSCCHECKGESRYHGLSEKCYHRQWRAARKLDGRSAWSSTATETL